MKNRILTLLAVVVSAGLVMAWGCGGKATLDGGTAYGEVEGLPINISGGAGAVDVLTASTKNVPIEPGGGRLDFGGLSAQGSGSITGCDIIPSALTHNGVPVIPKASGDPKADCDAAGKDPLNCITWEVTHPVSPKFAVITLRGYMYNIPTSDTDYEKMRLKCSVHVDVDDLSLEPLADTRSTSRLVEQLTVDYITHGSPDFAIVKPDFDLLSTILVDNDTNGFSGWDTTIATGCKGGVYPTCDFSADAVRDATLAQFNPVGINDWRKVISFSGKGSGATQVIDFDRYVEMMFTTEGVTASSGLDKVFDNTYLSYLFCDNVDTDCPLNATHADLTAFSSISSASVPVVDDGEFDPTLVKMSASVGKTFIDGTVTATNFTLAGTGLPAGAPATVSSLAMSLDNSSASLSITNAWAYEKQTFSFTASGIRAIDGANQVSIQKDPISYTLTAYPSVSTAHLWDHWGLESPENFAYAGLTQDEFVPAAALDSAAEANAAVLEYDGVNFLEMVDGTSIVGADATLVMTVADMAVDEYPITASIKVDDIVNATPRAGEMVGIRLADDLGFSYYFAGLEYQDIGGGVIHLFAVGFLKVWDTDQWVQGGGTKVDLTALNLSNNHVRTIEISIDEQNGVTVNYLADDDKMNGMTGPPGLGCPLNAATYFEGGLDCSIPYVPIVHWDVSTIAKFEADSELQFKLLEKRIMNLRKSGYIEDKIIFEGPGGHGGFNGPGGTTKI